MEIRTKSPRWLQYVVIALGTTLMAVAVNIVFEPMDMVTGGVSGLAIVIKYWTEPFIPGGVPLWLSNALINIPLFIFAIVLFGRKYIAKTLYATVCFTVALYIVPNNIVLAQDYFLASIFGGVLMGAGLGMVFFFQCTTGGTDLFSSLLHLKLKHYTVPQILMVVDSSIVLLGAVVFGMNKSLYAVIAVYLTSKIMDNFLEGVKFAKLAYIISDHHEEIAHAILHDMSRGVTGVSAQGMYSNDSKNMLLCVVTKKEISSIIDRVAQIDPYAFVIVSDVREVLGEGFIEYKQ